MKYLTMGTGVKCPNHGCLLDIEPSQKLATKGKGICPVSGAVFDFEQNVDVVKKDKFGKLLKSWTLDGTETK